MILKASGEDWSRFENDLHKLVNFNFRGLHAEVGEYLLDATKERFRKGESPTGEAWPESIRAKETGGRTMMDTRTLYNSLTYKASIDKVEVGTNVKYAQTHQPKDANQTETKIEPKKAKALKFQICGKWATKDFVKVPARRFLGINDNDTQEIEQIVQDRIEGCFQK